MKKLTLVFALLISIASVSSFAGDLLVEAELFQNKGGWEVDGQFIFEMGSPYLLAHGLGEPVENAKTSITFEEKGTYNIWVRTKNWVPGNWDAPGKFRLLVNGKEFTTDLGVLPSWQWQYVDKISVKSLNATLELKDLTGFDGRCDAIYFSTKNIAPPENPTELAQWRNKLIYKNDTVIAQQNFDLVIVGGGIAGCATAIAAAEEGLNVALINDRAILGGNASMDIRVHTLGITWKYDRILSKINTMHWPNASIDAEIDDKKRHENIKSYKNIHLFLNYKAYQVKAENNTIRWVDAKDIISTKRIRFSAPVFADCTGDGWIGYWAGAEYMYGREPDTIFKEYYHELKDSVESHFFKNKELGIIDPREVMIPKTNDGKVMGTTLMWYTNDTNTPYNFPAVPWAMSIAGNYAALAGEWFWEYTIDTLHQIYNAEQIRDNMLRAIYGSFSNAKKDSANKYKKLEWVAYVGGKRESRRFVGDYIFTINDAKLKTKFEDAVVKETRHVDIHAQQNEVNPELPSYLSNALYYKAHEYYIPYRSLYSKNINNLFMAGRNFSCSHLGLGGPRVMNTTGQMGCAIGYAASLCVKNNVLPRDIYTNYLSQLLELIENSDKVKSPKN